MWWKVWLSMVMLCAGCQKPAPEFAIPTPLPTAAEVVETVDVDVAVVPETPEEPADYGGSNGSSFKIPLPAGYAWEVTQSWAEHCEYCSEKYDDWDYCKLSHQSSCCEFSYDFNLPGPGDSGKSVLASRDGYVQDVGLRGEWGYTVLIDHGNNICTRSAHMLEDSVQHLDQGQFVCQGMKIGEIGSTGAAEGAHLHFQFEDCETGESLALGFTDGNGVPLCTRGSDVYDSDGDYDFLKLTNVERHDCGDEEEEPFGGGELPEGGWLSAECGGLSGCPLVTNCGRGFGHQFSDHYDLDTRTAEAAEYLWSECAVDGKSDGGLHAEDRMTRAEALKVALFLFGMMDGCGSYEPFDDVVPGDWFYEVVACAVDNGIVSTESDEFYPNREVTFVEAAKFVVEAAARAEVIDLQNPADGHFAHIPNSHWAYRYVETLFVYGGLEAKHLAFQPDKKLERGDFFMMTASLSPCYCKNISCKGSCSCDQENYACNDPSDPNPGTGGNEEEEPKEEEEEEPEPWCTPDCDSKHCGPDGCGGECGFCPYDHYCDYDDRCKPYPCDPQTCSDRGYECGYHDDGCNYAMYCGGCPDGWSCQDGQCEAWDEGEEPEEEEEEPEQPETDWECNSNYWLTIEVFAPDGEVHGMYGPDGNTFSLKLTDEPRNINVDCESLPVFLLVEPGPGDQYEVVCQFGAPMALWAPYYGALTANPGDGPDDIIYFLDSILEEVETPFMLKIPAD